MYHNKRYSMKEIYIGVKGGSKWNRRINCVLKNRKPPNNPEFYIGYPADLPL